MADAGKALPSRSHQPSRPGHRVKLPHRQVRWRGVLQGDHVPHSSLPHVPKLDAEPEPWDRNWSTASEVHERQRLARHEA
jgi:hypothetical protein